MIENNELMEDFLSQLNRKLDTVTPLSESETLKLEKELSGMTPEEVNAYLGNMFNMVRQPYKRLVPKFGRNEPCFCGSGKKYKNCCQEEFESYVQNISSDEYNQILNNSEEQDNTDIRNETTGD